IQTNSSVACCNPRFRAEDFPPFGFAMYSMGGPHRATTSGVASGEPSSTTMIWVGGKVCPRMLERASPRYPARLYVGTIAVTEPVALDRASAGRLILYILVCV